MLNIIKIIENNKDIIRNKIISDPSIETGHANAPIIQSAVIEILKNNNIKVSTSGKKRSNEDCIIEDHPVP